MTKRFKFKYQSGATVFQSQKLNLYFSKQMYWKKSGFLITSRIMAIPAVEYKQKLKHLFHIHDSVNIFSLFTCTLVK